MSKYVVLLKICFIEMTKPPILHDTQCNKRLALL